MNARRRSFLSMATVAALCSIAGAPVRAETPMAEEAPAAAIDLETDTGLQTVQGEWRYSDTTIVPREHRAPDADGQPTGAPIRTYDFTPHAGGADFDDSRWPVILPTTLHERRSTGRLCFNWYRLHLTVPDHIGGFGTAGSTAVFETVIDDYAEVWVNGELARALGQSGGSVIRGWNAPNRLVLGRDLKPGQKITVAVFGINGPISDPPANFIWMREAKLEFYRNTGVSGPIAVPPQEVNVEVERLDPELDAIVPANPKIYKLAEGFAFTEGPVWIPASAGEPGHLLFSDPNRNTIYRYAPDTAQLSVYREKSGYDGGDIAEYSQPGANGLALDPQGRLTIDQHGNHRVVRQESDGSLTVLADRDNGKRLNSPNDLVYRSDGTLYFTDPPFGLPRFFDDPRKELPYSGVYSWKDGKLRLVSTDLKGPNGLAFSPDEKYLYVDNWDEKRKVVLRYTVQPDGALTDGRTFFDITRSAPGEIAWDGLKVDQRGNLYLSGPGGIWIVSAAGKHLGTIKAPQIPANFAWGDADGKTLYLTARTGLYRIRLNVAGATVHGTR